jgi:hypothetical protein
VATTDVGSVGDRVVESGDGADESVDGVPDRLVVPVRADDPGPVEPWLLDRAGEVVGLGADAELDDVVSGGAAGALTATGSPTTVTEQPATRTAADSSRLAEPGCRRHHRIPSP